MSLHFIQPHIASHRFMQPHSAPFRLTQPQTASHNCIQPQALTGHPKLPRTRRLGIALSPFCLGGW